jgi:hypothetical protein
LGEIIARVENQPGVQIDISDTTREQLVQAALGLTADEAANVFNKALVLNGTLDESDIDIVLNEKKQIIRKSGALEFYEAGSHFSDHRRAWAASKIGWANAAKRGANAPREFGLPHRAECSCWACRAAASHSRPKAIGAQWKLPLLRFDVGAVFGKYVGESEANLRRALKAAEAVAPCVLWIDEMEKSLFRFARR